MNESWRIAHVIRDCVADIWMDLRCLFFVISVISHILRVMSHMNESHHTSTRPNVWFMVTVWLPDFRKLFYLSFSTNIKNLFRGIKGFKIWSSAKDYAVLDLLFNMVDLLIFTWSIWSGGNVWYQPCTSSQEAYRRGRPLNIFAWFIGTGGLRVLSHMNESSHMAHVIRDCVADIWMDLRCLLSVVSSHVTYS